MRRWLVLLSLLDIGRPYVLPRAPLRGRQPCVAAAAPARNVQVSMNLGGGFGSFLRNLMGAEGDEVDPRLDDDFRDAPADELEYVPLVLVIGAAGRTGRIIVRKLVLQGFRVAVLVRSLSTETLNLLGSGVSYSYGDMTDYRTLLDAMEDVDRVIFAADAEDEETELSGLSQVLRSFQDTRTFMYGDAEATKLSLLKMRRDTDFNRWRVEDSSEEIAYRLASAGIGPKPSVAYWKRSPTGAHKNGIFVGRVFDTYLGSAAVSCALSGLLIGGEASPALAAAVNARLEQQQRLDTPPGAQQQRLQLGGSAQERAALAGISSAGGGVGDAAGADPGAALAFEADAAQLDRAASAMAAAEVPLDLAEYSGLLIRAIGDGNVYTAVLRTREHSIDGLEYHSDFTLQSTYFKTVRLPFSNFVPVRGGRPVQGAPELDRHAIVGLALAFYPQRNNPAETTGEFYLSLANIKTYRKRDEPEIVYISDAGVGALPPLPSVKDVAGAVAGKASVAEAAEAAAAAASAAAASATTAAAAGGGSVADEEMSSEEAARMRRVQTKRKGEALLRASGLTYFIVRATELDDRPRGSRRLVFTQGDDPVEGSVSRTDVAEVAVRSLLDPRACNVACAVSESQAAAATPAALGPQDISKALEVLEPNRL